MKNNKQNISFFMAALHRKADARADADAKFNQACEALRIAIESGDKARIETTYHELSQALIRCNELGLF